MANEPSSAVGKGKVHFLTRDDILKAKDLVEETVYVAEWKGTVRVRSLTGSERDAFEDTLVRMRGRTREYNLRNFRARLVQLSARNDAGELLFTPNDVEALGGRNAAALERVFEVAQRLSGLRPDDVEELTRELGEDQSDGSGTA